MTDQNKIFLKTLRREKTDLPFWMMRQAGRYLPEYRKIREKAGSFLELCYNPELASEVTLQPIARFGMDAAIIFSDILVVPHALGLNLEYHEGRGPVLETMRDEKKIGSLTTGNVEKHLAPVFEALRLTKEKLPKDKALIGFAGAPWTVATYMVEGGSSRGFETVKKMAYTEPAMFSKLIEILVDETVEYLSLQISAGAEAIQIFDSWAGVLIEEEFQKWVIEPTKKIVSKIKQKHPEVPIIGFPKGANILLDKFIAKTGVDAISIDSQVTLGMAKKLQEKTVIQGNLDPVILLSNPLKIKQETRKIINALNGKPFIFNLGHGILPQTPIENVEAMVEEIRR